MCIATGIPCCPCQVFVLSVTVQEAEEYSAPRSGKNHCSSNWKDKNNLNWGRNRKPVKGVSFLGREANWDSSINK